MVSPFLAMSGFGNPWVSPKNTGSSREVRSRGTPFFSLFYSILVGNPPARVVFNLLRLAFCDVPLAFQGHGHYWTSFSHLCRG